MSNQTGRKPTPSVVRPIANQPCRQPPSCMASWAMIGMATSPDIWASEAMALARARRATNQLVSAP